VRRTTTLINFPRKCLLTTSPSFIPLNPPSHYLSSLSCNIIIHLITSVFLPSPSSLLTLPDYLLRIKESGSEEADSGRRERAAEEKNGEEGEREVVRKRMERKGEKGSEEDDYFNKFPPTMPEPDLHIMVVNIVLKFQSPLQVIMVFMPIGNSKWSTAKVKIA
jgi:hypothetical protein